MLIRSPLEEERHLMLPCGVKKRDLVGERLIPSMTEDMSKARDIERLEWDSELYSSSLQW
jgi:hypothetical protein